LTPEPPGRIRRYPYVLQRILRGSSSVTVPRSQKVPEQTLFVWTRSIVWRWSGVRKSRNKFSFFENCKFLKCPLRGSLTPEPPGRIRRYPTRAPLCVAKASPLVPIGTEILRISRTLALPVCSRGNHETTKSKNGVFPISPVPLVRCF